MDLVEIWRLPNDDQGFAVDAVEADLRQELAAIAPERERRRIAPAAFSRLR